MARLSRREFMIVGATAVGGLALGLRFVRAEAAPNGTATFAPDAFIRIANDGSVTLVMCQVEMGQGTYTGMPQLIVEELEVELDRVRLEHATRTDALSMRAMCAE